MASPVLHYQIPQDEWHITESDDGRGMRQARKLADLKQYAVHAEDGDIGRLREVYFDEHAWQAHYFVVQTGGWLSREEILVPSSIISAVDDARHRIDLTVAGEQVRRAPQVDLRNPLSPGREQSVRRHFGRQTLRSESGMHGQPEYAASAASPAHLRSSEQVTGYQIRAKDGEVGQVADIVLEDSGWPVRYIEVSTDPWLFGRHVLLAIAWIEQIDWQRAELTTVLTRDAIETAPDYDAGELISRDYQLALYRHYGMHYEQD